MIYKFQRYKLFIQILYKLIIPKMNKLILISMIICLAFAIQQRTQSHIQNQHFLDG